MKYFLVSLLLIKVALYTVNPAFAVGPGLSSTRLGAKLWTDVKALSSFSVSGAPALTTAQDAAGLAYWNAVAADIISELQTNAQVLPETLSVTPSNMLNGAGTLTGSGLVTTGLGGLN